MLTANLFRPGLHFLWYDYPRTIPITSLHDETALGSDHTNGLHEQICHFLRQA